MTKRFSAYFGLVLVLLATATGCSKSEPPRSSAPAVAAPPADIIPSSGGGGGANAAPTVRARALTVDASLTVDDVDARAAALRDAAEAAGGYVADATIGGEHEERNGHMELHVPATALTPFLAKFKAAGDVTNYNERAEDVTDQRTDLKARLKNARAQESRIQELMTTKTATLADTIEAEKELARVRENIERMDAQDRALDGRVAMATIRVNLQTRQSEAWKTPGASISRAAGNGVRGAAAVFTFAAMAIVTVAPTMIPIVLAIFAMVVAARAYGRRKRAQLA